VQQAFVDALNNKVKSKSTFKVRNLFSFLLMFEFSIVLQGHLKTYKYVDNVWQFTLEKCQFRTDSETVVCPEDVKIVCTDVQLSKTSALEAALAK